MITIIATIKPEHLGNIRSGRKKWEMRKNAPQTYGLDFKVLCCESGSGGNILAEFVCNSVEISKRQPEASLARLVAESCVTMEQAKKYQGDGVLHFWHISKMIDYCKAKGQRVRNVSEFGLTRAPQSWCYVKEKHDAVT